MKQATEAYAVPIIDVAPFLGGGREDEKRVGYQIARACEDIGGSVNIGFNAQEAYELLGLSEHSKTAGVKFMLNFDLDSVDDVDRLVRTASERGATLIKAPYKTYYNWYQAVLSDPEGNVFRLNKVL